MRKRTTNGNATTVTLIIFGILLVIVVLGGLNKFRKSGGIKFSVPTFFVPGGIGGVLTNSSSTSNCGFTLIEPRENNTVHIPFVISGVTNGCNWKPFERLVGVATMYDNKGKKVESIPIQIFSVSTTFPAPFSGMFTKQVSSGKATIKIKNAPVPGQRAQLISIPIIIQ